MTHRRSSSSSPSLSSPTQSSPSHLLPSARGFTLVELLVVIGIIALLISILLPSLARARRAANTVACAANLRSIMQGVHMFASQNKGALPGSAATTGRFALKPDYSLNGAVYNGNNFPNIVQFSDWQSPVAKVMGVKLNEGGTKNDRLERFLRLRDFKPFQCPETRGINASPFAGSSDPVTSMVPIGQMNSYVAATYFLYMPNGSGGQVFSVQMSPTSTSPKGYSPYLAKVKNSARKIFVADGARFSKTDTPPDFDLDIESSGGGQFADLGPWSSLTKGWNRDFSDGATTGIDCRPLAFRHGRTQARGPADTYKFNAAFFDGHVELLGDLQGADPSFWMPTGTIVEGTIYNDVVKRYRFLAKTPSR